MAFLVETTSVTCTELCPSSLQTEKEATRIEVVLADGLPVRSSNGVLRIGCWFADCELCP